MPASEFGDVPTTFADAAARGAEASPREVRDQELYALLAACTDQGKLDSLLETASSSLHELNSVNAAYSLIYAAKLIESSARGKVKRPLRKQDPRLLSLIGRVEQLVLAEDSRVQSEGGSSSSVAAASRAPSTEDPLSEKDAQASLDLKGVEEETSQQDAGLHMAWTISVTCWALGILHYENKPVLSALARLATPLLPQFRPVQLLNTSWAFASLTLPSPQSFLGAVAETVGPRLHDYNNQSLSTVLWSFASSQVVDAGLFEAVPRELTGSRAGSLRPQELANVVWSFATVRKPHQQLFSLLGENASTQLHEFRPQQVSLVAWSFAMVTDKHNTLFRAIERDVIARVDNNYPPASLASVLRAFVVVSHKSEPLFRAASSSVLKRLPEYNPAALANVCWALSDRASADREFFEKVAAGSVGSLKSLAPALLCGMLLTFSKVQVLHEPLFLEAEQEVSQRLPQFVGDSFVRLVRSFAPVAAAGGVGPEFLERLMEETQRRVSKFSPLELVHITKSFATMGKLSLGLLESLATRAAEIMSGMGFKELASIVPSLTSCGISTCSARGCVLYQTASAEALQRITQKSPRASDLAAISRAFAQAAASSSKRPLTHARKASELSGQAPAEAAQVQATESTMKSFLQRASKEVLDHFEDYTSSAGSLVGVLWASTMLDVQLQPLLQAATTFFTPQTEMPGAASTSWSLVASPVTAGSLTRLRLLELRELAEVAVVSDFLQLELLGALACAGAEALREAQALYSQSMGHAAAEEAEPAPAPSKAPKVAEDLANGSSLLRHLAIGGLIPLALARGLATYVLQMPANARGALPIPANVILGCITGLSLTCHVAGCKQALTHLAKAALSCLDDFGLEDRAAIVSSLATANHFEVPRLFEEILTHTPWSQGQGASSASSSSSSHVPVQMQTLAQVHLADLSLRLLGPQPPCASLSESCRSLCFDAAVEVHRQRLAALHEVPDQKTLAARKVMRALLDMNLEVQLGLFTNEGVPLQMVVVRDAEDTPSVCFEVDGPSDVVLQPELRCARPFPTVGLRRRLLHALGWVVFSLPWFKVELLQESALQDYLRRLLAPTQASPPLLDPGGPSHPLSLPLTRIPVGDHHLRPDSDLSPGAAPVSLEHQVAPPPGLGPWEEEHL